MKAIKTTKPRTERQHRLKHDFHLIVGHGANSLHNSKMLQTFSREQELCEASQGLTKGASQQGVLARGAAEYEPKQWRKAMRAGEGWRRCNLHIPLVQCWIGAYPHLAPTDSLSACNIILDIVRG